MDGERFRQENLCLTPAEISSCRGALGALQWLAGQSQILICARVNLLLSDLGNEPTMKVAHEIQELINECRREPTTLEFHKVQADHWQDVTMVTLGDQAHMNRPKGDSTGGLIAFMGGPELQDQQVGRMSILAWRTWKLRRKAIGTNDGEVQALVEAEDLNARCRLLWGEFNGAGVAAKELGYNYIERFEAVVRLTPGIVGTDSKGGYDAIIINESPLLGLSNIRAAVQAFQVKQSLAVDLAKLIWLAGDWNLSDALTKKPAECRQGLKLFLKTFTWKLKYDPNFIVSARKAKKMQKSATEEMERTWNAQHYLSYLNHSNPDQLVAMIMRAASYDFD